MDNRLVMSKSEQFDVQLCEAGIVPRLTRLGTATSLAPNSFGVWEFSNCFLGVDSPFFSTVALNQKKRKQHGTPEVFISGKHHPWKEWGRYP